MLRLGVFLNPTLHPTPRLGKSRNIFGGIDGRAQDGPNTARRSLNSRGEGPANECAAKNVRTPFSQNLVGRPPIIFGGNVVRYPCNNILEIEKKLI